MKRVVWICVALTTLMIASNVSAALYLLQPPDGTTSSSRDLQDLSHDKYYVWDFHLPLAKKVVTSATLEFRQMYNTSPSQYDALYVHLLNMTTPQYSNLGSPNHTTTQSGVLMHEWVKNDTNATKANPFISDSFTGIPWNDPTPLFTWYNQNDTTPPNNPPIIPVTYSTRKTISYDFSPTDLAILNSYLSDGLFALGIDSDCHYNNTGVMLTLQTGAVPEPGTMTLLGSGLFALAGWGRKKVRL